MESIPPHPTPILVVDDDIGVLLSIEAAIVSAGMPAPALASDARRVLDLVREHGFHLVLLDLIMPHVHGLDVLRDLKETHADVECIIVTAIDEVETAVKAIRLGAYDYLVKPLDRDKMTIVIRRALERHHLIKGLRPMDRPADFSDLRHPEAFAEIVTQDPAMAAVFRQAELAGPSDCNLIISGETGTGKGLLARAIHNLGPRFKGPFISVNMAASSRELFADDFFGHVRGAFTGACAAKKGFIESAIGGTLFMDEITEMPPQLQVKLLKVIEEKQVQPLGAEHPQTVDVRFIAATNRHLPDEMDQGRFRRDLFYRLNVFHIHIPPLRLRRHDIPPLALHFLGRHARKGARPLKGLSPGLIQRLMRHDFPGNVRELENLITAGALAETGPELSLNHIPGLAEGHETRQTETDGLLTLSEMEKRHIRDVLEATHGNRSRAAQILGIGIRTLRRKLNATSGSDRPE